MYMRMYIYIYIYIHMRRVGGPGDLAHELLGDCMYIIYTYVYVCIYIYIYIHSLEQAMFS